jgi:hypothetical protein
MSTTPGPCVVSISTPMVSKPVTPTSEDLAAMGRRISVPTVEEAVRVSSPENEELKNDTVSLSSSNECELDCLREQLQQALDEKAELIEESLLDKERIKDQRETIELLTKRIREFEMMGRSSSSSSLPSNRVRPGSNNQIKQLSEDNIQLAREVDRLISERDRLEKKLIDLKIKLANGYLSRQTSGASTDEDEVNVFSTLSVDERLRKKKGSQRVLGPSSASKSGGVFSAARSWFSKKGPSKSPSKSTMNRSGKSNEITSSSLMAA